MNLSMKKDYHNNKETIAFMIAMILKYKILVDSRQMETELDIQLDSYWSGVLFINSHEKVAFHEKATFS